MCSGPASGADTGEKNTCKGGADTMGSETDLKVLKGLLGKWGLHGAHHGDKDTDGRGTMESLLLFFNF